jgi:carboxy-cis,cis-muconate cyclase
MPHTHGLHLMYVAPDRTPHQVLDAKQYLQHRKKNIYGVSLDAAKLSSYSILSNSSLKLMQSIKSEAACQNRTAAYITARTEAPYIVYTAAWPGPNSCGQAIAVDRNGTMCSVIQVFKFQNESAVQGMTVNDESGTLYSADFSGDYIWAHSINEHSGALELVQRKRVQKGMGPRHLVTYPNGQYLYVVNQKENSLNSYSVNRWSGEIEDVQSQFSLLPKGKFVLSLAKLTGIAYYAPFLFLTLWNP